MKVLTRTLGEVCDEVNGVIRTGPFGSQLHESDYSDEGTPVVMPKDIIEGRVSEFSIARVDEGHATRLAQHKLAPGEIVYGRRGDIGRQALITEREAGWLCGTGCLRISLGNRILDPTFLHYYLRLPSVVAWIANQAIGATLPNLNTSILRSVPITYPPLAAQQKIAAVLSAYDVLIENNRRRIAILEEMARALYREWFVDFRFPGHEGVQMVETAVGPIPEGWEVRPIGEVVEICGGGTPATGRPEYWQGGNVIWYSPSDLTAAGSMFMSESSRRITERGLQESSARLFPACSVMLTSRATIGVVAINTQPACTNQGFITCLQNERISAYHLYFWLLDHREKIIGLASGATFKEINKATFRRMEILVPPRDVAARLSGELAPMGNQIQILQQKNISLRATRDLLLPRLISGEVDVEGLEIAGADAEPGDGDP